MLFANIKKETLIFAKIKDIQMDNKNFAFWNRITALSILFIATLTYLLTIEPSASFWDCGEFIASSYKLEVGHPPGNPVFQLLARIVTIFTGGKYAAMGINAMSAVCSGFTIFFLYLTIVFFAKRLVTKNNGNYSLSKSIAIMGSAAIGALSYCFSDTFWFSAVEAEVYAMSSLFTAVVVWAMCRWYDEAEKEFANRWIILICFLTGLSIGVHLLNLLAIPALVFLYFFKKREEKEYSYLEIIGIGLLSIVLIALVLFVIIPYVPSTAAYVDLFFVNILGLPINTGAAIFSLGLIALCFWGAFWSLKHSKILMNHIMLGLCSILIGFSIFSIIIIRSKDMTPTNEYQPDNAFTLVRYLSREQYGSAPLLYGQYFDSPVDIQVDSYYAPLNGKYIKSSSPAKPIYESSGKMLFPRMWSNASQAHIQTYLAYTKGKGTHVEGAQYNKPSFLDNLYFFWDYQLNWMYWRYFMWNFAGRQNDVHSPQSGNILYGNWESGIPFIDNIRLGDQSNAPEALKNNKAKNHYYLLPLLLGLIGLFFQSLKDKRGLWICFLLFFMTGIAIILYLNQSPLQVRERDYAYAASFYTFAIWIGFGILAIYEGCKKYFNKNLHIILASILSLMGLSVPALMAEENWDDHDRSNRATAVEMARNYLNSVGKNGILITHGDNDTFTLWYAQEVENVRPDVRICNTSLLGTDWHINQMKYASNDSKALALSIPEQQYLYGTNEYIPIIDSRNKIYPLKQVMEVFKSPKAKINLGNGRFVDYIASRSFSIPVNKENVIKYGIVPKELESQIPDEIILSIPKDKNSINKPELFMLDLLSNYNWDRPINLLSRGGDINMGIKDYLMFDGFSYRFTPIKNSSKSDYMDHVDINHLYKQMSSVNKWDAISRTDYYADYQNLYTFIGVIPQRELLYKVAKLLADRDDKQKAIELLDKAISILPEQSYPYESICLGFVNNDLTIISIIELYLQLSEKEKAIEIARTFIDELFISLDFFIDKHKYTVDETDACLQVINVLKNILIKYNITELSNIIDDKLHTLYNKYYLNDIETDEELDKSTIQQDIETMEDSL